MAKPQTNITIVGGGLAVGLDLLPMPGTQNLMRIGPHSRAITPRIWNSVHRLRVTATLV
jgi:hypothetical protein